MRVVNTIGAVTELLALAKEIEEQEHVDKQVAFSRALAELPRLTNDVQMKVRYAPRTKPVTRWRPVHR